MFSFYTRSAFTHSYFVPPPPKKPLFLYCFLMLWTFVTDMKCVYLAVGTFRYMFEVNIRHEIFKF